MAKFQLKMATQLGEKTAADFGFVDFPIDPLKIAKAKNISVEALPAGSKGISGALIFAGSDVALIYSTDYNNAGFERFSISHELGHYFLPGHPEEILKQDGKHFSRANFTENSSIELEADHFASGLLMPSTLVRKLLGRNVIGLDGIIDLADKSECSRTAAAIRAAECSEYPVAVIMSQGDKIAYAFMSDGFKKLGQLSFLRKGDALPASMTRTFNADTNNVLNTKRVCQETTLGDWFGSSQCIALDEEIIGLGSYGYTLTVLSSDELPADPNEDDEDEEKDLEDRWTPRFAYGR